MEDLSVNTVTFEQALHSEAFAAVKGALPVVVGIDEQNNIVCRSLTRMPHMLVCGAVGSGKSVMLHGVVASIVAKNTPDEVRLAVADPKMVEFAYLQNSPYLVRDGYITSAEQFEQWKDLLISEVERRYEKFYQAGVWNIVAYNEAHPQEKMPYIVTIVDELADMYTGKNKKKVQSSLVRIVQKARAAGIHLVVATCRFGPDVLPATFVANMPCRTVFRVPMAADSVKLAGMSGAENLRGMGQMLFVDPTKATPMRLQALYVGEVK